MEERLPAIGNLESQCPYCAHSLDPRPQRKSRCPHCGEEIHVLTRPVDRQRVLLTEDQAEKIKEQWAIVDGLHAEYLLHRRRVREARADLAATLGKKPSHDHVRFKLLIEDAETHARHHQWGFFCSVRQEMAEIVRRTSELKDALSEYLEVCYLQLNGPNNLVTHIRQGQRTPVLDRRFPPWDPKHGEVVPLTLERTRRLVEETGVAREAVREMFVKAASDVRPSLSLPLSPERAWRRLRRRLYGSVT
jgi:hypothetical protein